MPWKDVTRMDSKVEMIERWESGLYGKIELARMYGVSRPTVDKWIGRYEAKGIEGLKDRSRRPKSSPKAISDEVAARVIRLKQEHSHWGPRKLLDWLERNEPGQSWPAASTIGELLDRHGLVTKRRKRRNYSDRPNEIAEAVESGEMMTADYKGEFRLGNGLYCYPLTIGDPVSRFSYAIDAHASTNFSDAQKVFKRIFREYGLPRWIKSDNGGPFSSPAIGGISRLSVWWIKLGIEPVRIDKGAPWQNGRHERMHRTLKAETTRPPEKNLKAQQSSFDRFRLSYNEERPHEALGGEVPCDRLILSGRSFPRRTPTPEYPAHFEVRKVHSSGCIKLRGQLMFISEVLEGEYLGLEEIDDDIWSVQLSTTELARWDLRREVLR